MADYEGFTGALESLGIDQPQYSTGDNGSGRVANVGDDTLAAKQLGVIRDRTYDASKEAQDAPRGALGTATARGNSLEAKRKRMDNWFMTKGMKDTGAAWNMLSGQGT